MSSTSVRTVLGQTYVSFCYYTSNEDKITRWIHSFVNEWSKKKKSGKEMKYSIRCYFQVMLNQ